MYVLKEEEEEEEEDDIEAQSVRRLSFASVVRCKKNHNNNTYVVYTPTILLRVLSAVNTYLLIASSRQGIPDNLRRAEVSRKIYERGKIICYRKFSGAAIIY